MIFVTVGTHEQQFDRLVQAIDVLCQNHAITEEVIIQTGYCTYKPQNCQWSNFFPYEQMLKYVADARIVITHGGPSSFIMPLQLGKTPIVVPRQSWYGEHVNNHQVEFCREMAKKHGNILVAEDMQALELLIGNYNAAVAAMPMEARSNNETFCQALDEIIEEIIR